MPEETCGFDELIDEALARLTAASPDDYFETRLLSTLRQRAAVAEPRRRWLPLSRLLAITPLLIAMFAGALIIVRLRLTRPTVFNNKREIEKPETNGSSRMPLVAAAQENTAERALNDANAPVEIRGQFRPSQAPPFVSPLRHTSARAARFPTPVPLTQQERALLHYVSRAHIDAAQLSAESPEAISDLRIQALDLPPLAVKPLNETNEHFRGQN